MTYLDSLSLSWKNVKANKLRTAITIVIMALGIFALILIITSIQAASNSLTSSFSTMGANAFSIRYAQRGIRFGNDKKEDNKQKKGTKKKESKMGIPISYDDARLFKKRYSFPGAKVGIAIRGSGGIVVNNDNKKTNPEITMYGGDENYLSINGYNISYGRNFTPAEINSGRNVCIIGNAVAERLYPTNKAKAIDQVIKVNKLPYRVIGVLEDKGSSAFFNTSKVAIVPFNNIRRLSTTNNANYNIAVMVEKLQTMEAAIGEAIGTFRPVRKLDVREADNFAIDKSDSIAESLLTNLGFLEKGTIGIAFITLMGAAIGLMNIMLVAVNERTKEIGLTKALGGTKKDIRSQFLFESVIISLLGALAGIVSGVAIGNVVALLLGTGFVVPWMWVIGAILVCSAVGLAAGLYPAYKASNLDPIVALRYE